MKHNFYSSDTDIVQTPRTIDLYGRACEGGLPKLWKCAVQVVPIDTFERRGRWIRSGHYVIYYGSASIVVHCGNAPDGRISVQFMHDELVPYIVARSRIEPMLLGQVVISEEQRAAVFEGRRLSDMFKDKAALINEDVVEINNPLIKPTCNRRRSIPRV